MPRNVCHGGVHPKTLRLLLFLIVTMAMLPGCEPAESPHKGEHQVQHVSFLHYFSGSLRSGFTKLTENFNASNSEIELQEVSLDHEAFKSSILDTLKSGNPPDIYSYWAGARTASIVDHLEPLDDMWQNNQLNAKFASPLLTAASRYDGKTYLLPLTQHLVGFFYNKTVFGKYGIEEPQGWKAFLEVCERLKNQGIIPIALGAKDKWPAQFWFDMLLLRTAPFEFRQALMNGNASYKDQRVTRVLKEWAALLKKGYFNENSADATWDHEANGLIFRGKAAMTLMGTWNIGYFTNAEHNWRPEVDFGFFPFPEMDSSIPMVALGPIDGMVIPKNAANIAGAKKVLSYMASAEPQELISRGSGALSPSKEIPAGFYNPTQLKALQAITESQHFAFNFDLATPPAIAEVGLNAFTEILVFPEAIENIQAQLAVDVEQAFATIK